MTSISDGIDKPTVFVSFGSAQHLIASDLAQRLDDQGFSSFFAPRDIKGSANFAVEIVRAISSCEAVVVLLDPSSLVSQHVRREVTLAIDERRILLPVAMPGTVYPVGFSQEWTYWLSAVQVMAFQGADAVVERVQQLLRLDLDSPKLHQRSTGADAPRKRTRVARRPIARAAGSPTTLLRAERAVVGMIGRDAELVRIEQWCSREEDFDARVITGTAGIGKTRLALELAQRLRTSGWDATFLQPSATGSDAVLGLSDRPHLFIADYAETRVGQLTEFLDTLLDYGIEDKVRLLLLARSASDWWKRLTSHTADFADLLADSTIQPLESFTSSRDDVESLYGSAVASFSSELGLPVPKRSTPPYREYATVLDVLEEALAAVMSTASRGAGSQANERLLSHERGYIFAAAQADGITMLDAVDLNRIAAILTLYGASDEDEASSLVGECNLDIPHSVRRRTARLFRRLYPGRDTYIQGLRPDALAESLLAGLLEEDGKLPGGRVALTDRTLEQRRCALITLARTSSRHPSMRAELGDIVRAGDEWTLSIALEVATQVEDAGPLLEAITSAVENRPDVDTKDLLEQIPDETVAMAELAAVLARRVMQTLPEPDRMDAGHVELAMQCSNRFSDAGWNQDAAASADVAVTRLNSLVTSRGADGAALGRALTNLSNRLWEKGDLEASISPAVRAVEVITVSGGAPHTEAALRNNLAFRLCENENQHEALSEALQALRLCEHGSPDVTTTSSRTLGSVLNNLTCIYFANGDAERALEFGRRAVELRRSQAVSNRDQFLPYVARAIANAAPAAAACGDHDTAERYITEARSLHAITGRRAPIFEFEEAESAALHAIMFYAKGNRTEAVRAACQSVDHLDALIALGELTGRLRSTLAVIIGAGTDEAEPFEFGVHALTERHIYVPKLLEFRDL